MDHFGKRSKQETWRQIPEDSEQLIVVSWLILTLFFLFVKYGRIRAIELWEKPYAPRLLVLRGWYSKGNAFEMLVDETPTVFLLSTACCVNLFFVCLVSSVYQRSSLIISVTLAVWLNSWDKNELRLFGLFLARKQFLWCRSQEALAYFRLVQTIVAYAVSVTFLGQFERFRLSKPMV